MHSFTNPTVGIGVGGRWCGPQAINVNEMESKTKDKRREEVWTRTIRFNSFWHYFSGHKLILLPFIAGRECTGPTGLWRAWKLEG